VRELIFEQHPLKSATVPASWMIVPLEDLTTDIQPGFPTGEHNREKRGVPHLRPMNISRAGAIDLTELKYAAPRPSFEVRRGDILFNNTNSPELIGKTALCALDASLAYSNHMTRVRVNGAVNAGFVAHQLHWLWMVGYFRHRCINHVNQASISSRPLAETVPIAVPPFAEQLRIVDEVEKQFTRIESASRSLSNALLRCNSSINALLRRFCSLPVELGSDGSAALPSGWQWVRVADAGEVKLGRQRAPQHHNGPYMRPYLRVANVLEDRLDLSDIKQMNFTPQEFDIYRLDPGDVLLNEGQSLELVGRAAIYRGELPGSCFQKTLLRFRPFETVLPEFALLVFRAYLRTGRFQKASRRTTTMAHLTAIRFEPMPFPQPPLEEQRRLVSLAQRELTLLSSVQNTIEQLQSRAARLRQAILAKAFSGQLVPQDPNDEPVSVLLERIRAESCKAMKSPRRARRRDQLTLQI
jgi:type I restriction enzyme, S subunit